jgi:cytochrome c553
MRMYRRFAWLGLLVVALAFRAIAAETLTTEEQKAARNLYVAKCAKCHRFYDPKVYSYPDWQTWLEKMNKKSKLKGDPASLLTRYLDAYRAGQLPGKPQDKPKSAPGGTAR